MARWSNQSILKEINSEYSLEGWILKLKLQYSGHLMQRADSLEKTLMLGKTEDRRKRGWPMKWLDGIIDSMGMSLHKLLEIVKEGETWRPVVHGAAKSWTQLSDWTTTTKVIVLGIILDFLLFVYPPFLISKTVNVVIRRQLDVKPRRPRNQAWEAKSSQLQQVWVKEAATHLSSRFSLGIRTLSNLRIPLSTPCRPRENRQEMELQVGQAYEHQKYCPMGLSWWPCG